jgi:hypothetical protein
MRIKYIYRIVVVHIGWTYSLFILCVGMHTYQHWCGHLAERTGKPEVQAYEPLQKSEHVPEETHSPRPEVMITAPTSGSYAPTQAYVSGSGSLFR